jgi:hypothetical protein
MSLKITLEFDAKYQATVMRALAMAEEMEKLALTAPDGKVFDACEQAVVEEGRKLQAHVLGEAVGRRIDAAEKRGRRFAPARAVAKKKIAAPKPGT